jgi:SNF2 family DNA or RNA helicase
VDRIAVMVTNASDDPRCKTNLILAPAALLDQWKLEIEMKTNNGLKCLIYHGMCCISRFWPSIRCHAVGPGKPRRKTEILKYDVVLTTYQTMANEWPDIEAEAKAKKKKKKPTLNGFIMSDSDDEVRPKKKKKEGESTTNQSAVSILTMFEAGLLFQIEVSNILVPF